MSCNSDIHYELLKFNQITCPYCDELLLNDTEKVYFKCCKNMKVINKYSSFLCENCGSVLYYENFDKYINFYENLYKIHKKSVYNHKYHIQNILHDIKYRYDIPELNIKNINKIINIFDEIYLIKHIFNINRLRIININFILYKIFELLNIPKEQILISKSEKTLQSYIKAWDIILIKIGNKIDKIIKS